MKTQIRRFMLFIAVALLVLSTGQGCIDLNQGSFNVTPADSEVAVGDGGLVGEGMSVVDRLGITSVSPEHGPFVGGTVLRIAGSGFTKETLVRIGGREVSATQLKLLSPIALQVATPAGDVGPADVEVYDGRSSQSLQDGYLYDPVYFDPASGPIVGNTRVTLYGKETNFKAGMTLSLGDKALTNVEIVSPTVLRALTPPHAAGPATLMMSRDAGPPLQIKNAYTYYDSANPLNGGLGGGVLNGTLTVTVLDAATRAPIDGATVYVQKERDLLLKNKTDATGVVVFASALLTEMVTLTAGKTQYETTTVVDFDARDATLLLTPIIEPEPGPFPPGQRVAVVEGNLIFGGPTGAGTTKWKIIPEPKAGQIKRAYVFISNASLSRQGPPGAVPTATIDYTADTGATGWPYFVYARPGGFAVYAVAGLYQQNTDTFEPYAMGIVRGLVVGPGERKTADILVNIPLTEKIQIDLKDVPAEMDQHRLRLGIDLGADGYILRSDMQLEADGVPAQISVGRLPKLSFPGLQDATWAVDLMLKDTANASGLPLVQASMYGLSPGSKQIVVDKFVGVPKQVKPAQNGLLMGNTLAWSSKGAEPSFAVTVITATDDTPIWRVISRGDVTEVKLPDPITIGLPNWPVGPLIWQQYLVHIPNFDFNQFNYSHLNTRYWDRWSLDVFDIMFKIVQ